jgi:putative hydrolase of the HAD superfamily
MAGLSAVAFDLDGTLLDHRTASARGLAHLVRELDAIVPRDLELAWWDAEDRHLAAWRQGRITFAEQRRRRLRDVLPLLSGLPAREFASDEQLDRIFGVYLRAYEAEWCLFPEVIAVLDAVASAGIPVGLLTNGTEEQQGRKLAATGIRDRFHVVCTSEAIGVAKPDARAFVELCFRLEVPPAQTLFVGDDYESDILGAQEAGLRGFFVDRQGDGKRRERGHPDLLPILPLLP